jgi:hypothetical protein
MQNHDPLPTGRLQMRIATWNVNSIKQRLDNLTAWLNQAAA